MVKKISKNKKQSRGGLAKRLENVLGAAADVFAEKGIECATIDEIARRAGVGKGTIYRQAGKKRDLIELLIKGCAQSVVEAIKSETKKRSDPLLQFKEAVNALCDIYEKNLGPMTVLMAQLILYAKAAKGRVKMDKAELSSAAQEVFRTLEDIFVRAIKKRQIRPVDVHAVVKGLFHFLNPYTYQYLRFKSNYTKGEIAQFTIDLFLDGLRPRK